MDRAQLIAEGLALCRQGSWTQGIERLAAASELKSSGEVSSLLYAYLGYGIAKFKGRQREGLALCEHAVKLEFFQPENQLMLARTRLLAGDRKRALEALNRGLKLDPDHAGLRELAAGLGSRRPPVLGFLGRDNFLNVVFGRLRHALRSRPPAS